MAIYRNYFGKIPGSPLCANSAVLYDAVDANDVLLNAVGSTARAEISTGRQLNASWMRKT